MSFFRQAILVEGGLAIVAILVDLLFCLELNYWEYFRCDGETCVYVILGLFPLIAGYFILLALPLPGLQQVNLIVRDMFRQYMALWKLWQFILIAVLAGFGEEMLFRGLIQLGCSQFLDIWLAILLTSLLFGLAHAITPTYFLLTFIISLYFGFLLVHTDNLIVPIAVHALYDLFVFLFIRYALHRN